MRNLWLVAKREFINRGRSSAYIVSTLMMVVALLGGTLLPALLASGDETEPVNLVLVDRTGTFAAPLAAAYQAMSSQPEARPINVEQADGADLDALKDRVLRENKTLLVVDGTFPDQIKATVLSGSPNMLQASGAFLAPLEGLVRAARMQKAGIDPQMAQTIVNPMTTEVAQLTASGQERSSDEFMGSFLLAFGVVMALYIVILMNSQFVFMGVLEEKTTRVVEVMAAAVRPTEMLSGKLIGLGGLGLLQFLFMLVAYVAGTLISKEIGATASSINVGAAVIALSYLVLGYILIAALMAAAASTISKMEDQQVVMTPIMILVMIPMFMVTAVMNDPNSTLATVMSMVPFFSQSVMVFRALMTDVPFWQMALSMLLMLATTVGLTYLSGRVYRAAMLSYGGRPTLKQIWGYLKA